MVRLIECVLYPATYIDKLTTSLSHKQTQLFQSMKEARVSIGKTPRFYDANRTWATYAWSGPWGEFDRPADSIQSYPVMWPEASLRTVADHCALTELSISASFWNKELPLRDCWNLGHSRECWEHLPPLCRNVAVSVSYAFAVIRCRIINLFLALVNKSVIKRLNAIQYWWLCDNPIYLGLHFFTSGLPNGEVAHPRCKPSIENPISSPFIFTLYNFYCNFWLKSL